ncbi:Chaperone protein DnaJ [Collinsella sp. AK_207A]|uniref:molecular chaperone DnaJ n=1 Tax=Collinsella sp. AK_207A TaxID=2650472 RepID=UPI0012604721|nr:molecular chaperone DnaJ [Collinsella sp. AK_207A]VWL97390.1 Chaperone protein DnaJ [Collinsella sp. AK_207A]
MSDKRDYYEVLGVERDADARTIKRAFLKKAREVHPDVSDDPDAEMKFKEVNEAYSVLSDEQKRANYDRFGTADGMGGSGYVDFSDIFGGMGMDDIFSSFFGGGAAGGHAGRQQRRQGRDMAISLSVTLEEAAQGCTKTISYDRLAPCEDCHGTGLAEGAKEEPCKRCHGTGYVTQVQRSIFGQVQSSAPCPDCHGEGTVIDHPCDMCDGQGRTPTHEKLDIKVPAGISSGRQLRVSGYGEAGYRGAPAGDLIVSVEVERHDRFERHGDDLYLDLSVSMVQAALGCTVEVDGIMPDERVSMHVPAGSQPGALVTVEGRGMPRIGGGGARGRLVARVKVVVPTELSAEARQALERYEEAVGEDFERKRSVGDRIRDAIDDILD